MKRIIYTFLNIFIFITSYSQTHYGDSTQRPNLFIPYLDYSYLNYPLGVAVKHDFVKTVVSNDKYPPFVKGDTVYYIGYPCTIANIAPQDSTVVGLPNGAGNHRKNDLSICRHCDGIPVNNEYSFPGLISVQLYKNGKLYSEYTKSTYNFENNEFKRDYNGDWWSWYEDDTMYISAQCGDTYYNRVMVSCKNGLAEDGFYTLRVWINPLRYITESNHDDNITLVNYKIENNTITINDSALLTNKPNPVVDFNGFTTWGSEKYVTLYWKYNSYEKYAIYKDNVLIADNISGNIFKDTNLKSGFKSATYTIYTKIDGLGVSIPVSKVVKKNN